MKFNKISENESSLTYRQGGAEKTINFDTVMIATGRKPNINGLGLDKAEVDFCETNGVFVNEFLRTSNKDVYALGACIARATCREEAVGDMAGLAEQFTHASDVQARALITNALYLGRFDRTKVPIPWVTYTEPEVAHVGKYAW